MELVKHDRRTSGATPCFSTSAHLGQDTQTASHLHLTARPHQKCPPWRPEGGQPSQSQKCIGNYHFKVPRRRRDQANVQLCVAKGDTNCIRMPNGFWVGFFFSFFIQPRCSGETVPMVECRICSMYRCGFGERCPGNTVSHVLSANEDELSTPTLVVKKELQSKSNENL